MILYYNSLLHLYNIKYIDYRRYIHDNSYIGGLYATLIVFIRSFPYCLWWKMPKLRLISTQLSSGSKRATSAELRDSMAQISYAWGTLIGALLEDSPRTAKMDAAIIAQADEMLHAYVDFLALLRTRNSSPKLHIFKGGKK